jgi:hypothetical protein
VGVEGDPIDDRGDEPGVGEHGAHSLKGRLVAIAMLARSSRSAIAITDASVVPSGRSS